MKVEFEIGDEVIEYVLLTQKLVPLILFDIFRLIVSLTRFIWNEVINGFKTVVYMSGIVSLSRFV